jgi:hypothetical protein
VIGDGLTIALAHAASGRAVFPFRLIRKASGKFEKRPLVPWQTTAEHESAATTDAATIARWWKRWPDALPGWVLPDGLIVADIDDRVAFSATGLVLPDGPSQQTPSGGEHRLYVGVGPQTVKKVPGLDTRVGGLGWVGLYEVDAFADDPPPAPSWLLAGRTASDKGVGNGSSPALDAIRDGHLAIRDGQRDTTLASIAGTLIRRGASASATALTFELLNAAGAIEQPDGDAIGPDDFRRIARSIAEREASNIATDEEIVVHTLAEIDATPADPLLLGMIEWGPNLFYAPGGTGKGSTGAFFCRELRSISMKPLIYDPENRPKEWARRCEGLGIDRSTILYLRPVDLPKSLRGRPLPDLAGYLKKYVETTGADILIVDSILAAAGVGEERLKSDAQFPYLYVDALDALGIPSVSFGHPPKGQPDGDPFGSVSWVNAMRLTWIGSRAGKGDAHVIRWRVRKKNERGYIAPFLIAFEYGADNRLVNAARENDEEATRDWIVDRIREDGEVTVSRLAEELIDDMPDAPAGELDRIKDRLRQALYRMSRDGVVSKSGTYTNAKWGMSTLMKVPNRVTEHGR